MSNPVSRSALIGAENDETIHKIKSWWEKNGDDEFCLLIHQNDGRNPYWEDVIVTIKSNQDGSRVRFSLFAGATTEEVNSAMYDSLTEVKHAANDTGGPDFLD